MLLTIKVSRGKQAKVIGSEKGILKVKLSAVREKGKANEQLIELLAKHFKVAQSKIKILKGEKATLKLVEILIDP